MVFTEHSPLVPHEGVVSIQEPFNSLHLGASVSVLALQVLLLQMEPFWTHEVPLILQEGAKVLLCVEHWLLEQTGLFCTQDDLFIVQDVVVVWVFLSQTPVDGLQV